MRCWRWLREYQLPSQQKSVTRRCLPMFPVLNTALTQMTHFRSVRRRRLRLQSCRRTSWQREEKNAADKVPSFSPHVLFDECRGLRSYLSLDASPPARLHGRALQILEVRALRPSPLKLNGHGKATIASHASVPEFLTSARCCSCKRRLPAAGPHAYRGAASSQGLTHERRPALSAEVLRAMLRTSRSAGHSREEHARWRARALDIDNQTRHLYTLHFTAMFKTIPFAFVRSGDGTPRVDPLDASWWECGLSRRRMRH
jgi:hypothetical protein